MSVAISIYGIDKLILVSKAYTHNMANPQLVDDCRMQVGLPVIGTDRSQYATSAWT